MGWLVLVTTIKLCPCTPKPPWIICKQMGIKKNYLFSATSGLSWVTWDLSLRRVGFSPVVARGLQSVWVQQLRCAGSVVAVRRLFSCGPRAQLPCGMWDLSSPTRDRTRVPCFGRRILNHWTTKEVPSFFCVCNTLFTKTGFRPDLSTLTQPLEDT